MDITNEVAGLVGDGYKISFMTQAGQKSVYRVSSQTEDMVLKLVVVEELDEDGDITPLGAQEERLRREVRLMASVNSEYLPELGSIGLQDHRISGVKYLYFSEAYLGDFNVKDIIKSSGFTPERLLQLVHDMACALMVYSTFEDGFVHRDIKPANIMVSGKTENFVLIDSGVHLLPSNPTMTLSDMFVGTARYASPEQLTKGRRSLDPRSDIFSLGVVIYEAATGRHPFFVKGVDPQECLINQTLAKYEPIADPAYERFNPMLSKMITQYQHSRYAGPEELLKEVEELKI